MPCSHGLPVGPGQVDEPQQRIDFAARHRPAVGATRQIRHDSLDAGTAGLGIADRIFLRLSLSAFACERPDEDDRVEELVHVPVVRVLFRQDLDELVVDEARPEHVIAFGQVS